MSNNKQQQLLEVGKPYRQPFAWTAQAMKFGFLEGETALQVVKTEKDSIAHTAIAIATAHRLNLDMIPANKVGWITDSQAIARTCGKPCITSIPNDNLVLAIADCGCCLLIVDYLKYDFIRKF